MGATKRQFVTSALEEIGLASYIFDMPPDALASVLSRLDSMMAQWNAKGLRLGYPIPSTPGTSDPDEETDVPDAAWEAITTNLALRVAPMFGRTPQPETKATAKFAYDTIMAKAAMPPQMQLPAAMPAGAGNKPWVWDDAFLQPPGDPLQAGSDSFLEFD